MTRSSISKLWLKSISKLPVPHAVLKRCPLQNWVAIIFVFFSVSLSAAQSRDSVLSLLFTGDVLLANHFKDQIKNDYAYAFARADWFKSADLSIINLESPLTTCDSAREKPFVFKAPPEFVKVLQDGGVDLANLANNHIYDYGPCGLLETIRTLKDAGIRYVGAGADFAEAHKPEIFERKGMKIGFLAYYGVRAHSESHPAGENDPGTALRRLKLIYRDVRILRPKVDFLVVIFHWGFEKEHYPKPYQIKFAHRVIDYGADLIVGHHPHVLQGVELYKGKAIVYSLGNFIFGGRYQPHYQTAVLRVELNTRNPQKWRLKFLPVQVDYWQPHLLTTAQGDSVLKHIETYSQIFEQTVPVW